MKIRGHVLMRIAGVLFCSAAAALVRALWQNWSRRGKSGASTLSMQVAKLYSPPAPRTLRTKLREMLQARRLEMTYSKEELLRAYLNRADFSNLCRGAETAAQFYFGKTAAELDIAEAALLAAPVKSPSALNPLRFPAEALRRRNDILQRLGEDCPALSGLAGRSINAPASAEGRAGQMTAAERCWRRSPLPARTARAAGRLPGEGSLLKLRSTLPSATVSWHSDSLRIILNR